MQIITVPANQVLQNLNITDTRCYDATQTITVAGSGSTFVVQSGARVTMIAGQKIRYLAGTTVKKGGYLRGYITTTGQYCASMPASMVAISTGEEEENAFTGQSMKVKIYPNPTNGRFTLELSGIDNSEKAKVEMYGMKGDRILSTEVTGQIKQEFSISGQPAGIYLIQVITSQGVVTNRIIKH
jgi:hypothetical protein